MVVVTPNVVSFGITTFTGCSSFIDSVLLFVQEKVKTTKHSNLI